MPEGGANLVGLVRGATAEEVVEALASWPGGVNGLSVDGESPVVACAEVGRVALLKSLLAANASPDAACTSGLSVLAAAAMTGNLECVQLLLEAGAAPDEPCGAMQVTPLSYAAQEGYRGVAEALIDAGADATRPDLFGSTPIAYATRRAEENRVRNFNFHTWVRNVTKRAEIVEAEPPPPRPHYPHDIRASLGAAHAAKEPTSVLWRAGGWVHQKQAPSAAVAQQRAPRPFSSTGFGVEEPRPAPEESVLPAERMVLAEVAESIDEELQSRLALERSERNPQLFADDVPVTADNIRRACVKGAIVPRLRAQQESAVQRMYPQLASFIRQPDGGGIYYGETQKEAMVLPDAAASMVPVLEGVGEYPPGTFVQPGTVGTRLGTRVCFGLPEGSLVDVLSRPPRQPPVDPGKQGA